MAQDISGAAAGGTMVIRGEMAARVDRLPMSSMAWEICLGTGWTDGVGHLGAWGGVLLAGAVFTAAAPLGWIWLITIPGALMPAVMIAIFGQSQRRRALEEIAQ